MNDRAKGLIAGIISNAIFGYNIIWLKQSLVSFRPFSGSTLRVLLAVIVLLIYATASKKLQKIKLKDLGLFILGGIFMPFLFLIFVFESLDFLNALIAGIIYATLPLFSPIAGHFFFKEKFHHFFFVGMIISFLGILFTITSHGFHLEVSTIGMILAFLAIFSYIAFSVVIKKLSHSYNEATNIFYTNLFGLIFLLPIFFATDFSHFIHTKPNVSSMMAVFNMGLFSSFIGLILYAYCIKKLGTGKSLLLFNLVPISSTVGSVLVLGEHLGFHKAMGLIVVIIGLLISMIKPKHKAIKSKQEMITHK